VISPEEERKATVGRICRKVRFEPGISDWSHRCGVTLLHAVHYTGGRQNWHLKLTLTSVPACCAFITT